MAKPTVYREDVAERILERVAAGDSVHSICRSPGMPKRDAVAQWIYRDFRDFGRRYYEAFAARCSLMAQECIDIVDEAQGQDMAGVTSARNRADMRKWLLSRLIPERFGDRLAHDHQVSGSVCIYLPENGRLYETPAIEGTVTEQIEGPEQAEDG
jgi:hypothetical protein